MSELDPGIKPEFIGRNVFIEEQDGSMDIELDPIEGEFMQVICIRPEDRLAVALVLLGGLSDDLIERVGAVIAEQFDLGVIEGETVEQLQAGRTAFNAKVRTVLREAFGLTETDG